MAEDFIKERDRRIGIISDKGLIPMIQENVKINNKPISARTVKETFKVERFDELKGVKLRVWYASETLIEKIEEDLNVYSRSI